MMDNTLHLVSNRERCEGKRAVAIFWLGLCSIITTSLDSKPVSAVQKPHTLPLISLALCGDICLTVWISVLEFVHSVYLFWGTCTSGACFRQYLPMQSGRNDTNYLMFILWKYHQIFSRASKILVHYLQDGNIKEKKI